MANGGRAIAEEAIASPLNLLSEEEHAREVLLLSYSLNLEFWERYALSVARGLGARVTVVGDAAMVSGEPAHVRYAGVTYLDGRAMCVGGGAFHPKLLVIAGDDYATVAIGSGNATLPGWHDNAELWTVLRGDTLGAPDTFLELAGWLRALPEMVRFSAAVTPALERVADLLERLPTHEPGPKLVSSQDHPIADQLPSAAADELILAAPFHDRAADGLRALLDHFQPTTTRLLLQPRDVVADGDMLASLLAERGGAAEAIASERYYHGKLIEWTAGERRFALTGSPNLSRPALLQTHATGGNCELALLTEVAESLAPPSGGAIPREELAAITFSSREDPPPGIALLGVMLGPDRVEITLGRPLSAAATLEYALAASWENAGPIPEAVVAVDLEITLAPGTAVRVRKGTVISNVCFVADPSRFSRTRVEHLGRVSTNEEDVFKDASVADAFAHDLAELRHFLNHTSPAAAGGAGAGGASGAPTFTSWEEYLDACEAQIGERLLAYGLALPALGSGEGRREEADGGTLADDSDVSDAAIEDELAEEVTSPAFDDLSATQRRRYQRWCERLAEMSPQLPYAGRLVALRLILDAIRGELFPRRDAWLPLLARTTEALGAAGHAFEEERIRAGSLAAVALAAMRSKLRRFADWEELRFPYERAAVAVTPLLEDADPDTIARYCAPLERFFGFGVTPAAIEELVSSLLKPDLIEQAVQLAGSEFGVSAERDGNVIHLNDPIPGDARRTLLSIISLCEQAELAVVTPAWSSHQAIAIWSKPELLLATRNAVGVRGALYELRGFGPGTYKDDVQGLPRPAEQWSDRAAIPTRAHALLTRLGVELQ